ncbi:DMT family transporter [Novosphingobium taihuense]|uniref:Drug/metabolite transporter (DMT)-like permease n=1 Tax=Novosphingobium taihuense TaxID=260085 RepID=A0A7W7ABK2_9SPHN|nr:DMT family transporter [Novosphingobium taihuense]MBB4613988.1 drug/metabolite transporter (DMT)-like permease [Novosphingobium taihuense]TWH86839.1 drug/metabolite transporter (DMT)-like permease [Novosphingobium taihuense]
MSLRGAYAFPIAAVLLWGGNAVVTKASAGVIGAAEIAFWRWLIAALVLLPFALPTLKAQWAEVRESVGRQAVLGLLGSALFPTLMYLAAAHTSAINMGVIQALMPIMALGLAMVLFRQTFSPVVWIGALVSLLGVAVVVTQGNPARLIAQGINPGDAFMLAATACFALYSTLVRKWRNALPQVTCLLLQATSASIVLAVPFALSHRTGVNAANLPIVLYAAVLASIAAPLLWMGGIVRIGPARAANFFNGLPVVAAALAVLFLGERVTLAMLPGALLVIGGVMLAERYAARAVA